MGLIDTLLHEFPKMSFQPFGDLHPFWGTSWNISYLNCCKFELVGAKKLQNEPACYSVELVRWVWW
jgi:hypothetical protein